jgi:fructokinase
MFLVCGEAVIDFFQEPGRPLSFHGQPAGSPFNVAVGLRRLGARSTLVTGLSRDPFGERLIAALAAEGVGSGLAPRTDRPTILSFVMLKADGGPEYAFYGENGADADVPVGAISWPLPPEIDAIHIGGFPMAVEPSKSSYATLVRQAAKTHFVSLDPNIRPRLVGDMSLFRTHFESLCASAALIKASTEDLSFLYPGMTPDAAAEHFRALGAATAVITDGPNGAIAVNQAGRAAAPTPAITVVDTVGAGDSFMSALLAETARLGLLDRGRLAAASPGTIGTILAFANRAAGITCGRRGANPPTRAEMGGA